MKWLVISDIHSAIHDFPTVNAQEKLIDQIKREGKKKPFDFVLITGDCMDRCSDSHQAVEYIKSIKDACKIDRDHIFICPGNHDILRPNNKDPKKDVQRIKLIKELRNGRIDIVNTLSLEGKNAFPWRDTYGVFSDMYKEIKGYSYEPFAFFEPEGEAYRILSIDSCMFSMDDNDAGHLYVSVPKLMQQFAKMKNDNKLNIAMMHHGVTFLEQEDARMLENALADYNIDVLYCGHSHRTGMAVLADAIKPDEATTGHRVREFTCGACHVNDYQRTEATFFVCEYDDNERIIKTTAYHFATRISDWGLDATSTRPFKDGINIYRIPRGYPKDRLATRRIELGITNDDMNMPVAVYENPNVADSRTKELIAGTEFLYYMGIKGDQIYEDDYHGVGRFISENKEIEARFLLANPVGSYLEKRLQSLTAEYKTELSMETHWRSLYERGISLYDECRKEENWSVRYHNEPVIFKLYIFSQCLLLGYYIPEEHSKNSPLYEYKVGSRIYQAFKLYFEEKWSIADKDKPAVDVKHSFFNSEHEMVPTLVINVTDRCGFTCYYCPRGGENLHEKFNADEYASVDEIKHLMKAYVHIVNTFVPKNKPVLRITGGEPFLDDATINKVHTILKEAQKLQISKIVICTNGEKILEAYNKEKALWDSLKDALWLKISLDTLKPDVLKKIARLNQYGILERIKDAISKLKEKGFLIELNTVLNQYSYTELESIYDYACDLNLYGVKVFTVNNFGGKVTFGPEDRLSKKLKELLAEMTEKGKIFPIKSEFLNQDAGIRMGMFTNNPGRKNECTLKIVDHQRGNDCITPDRTYGNKCYDCKYYQKNNCATGLMSLTMRADGRVSYCRLREEDGFTIKNQNAEQITSKVHEIMGAFKHCKREN